jgi:hypothetical protein
MIALQVSAEVPAWSRTAIHDTVAAIVRQAPYRRDIQQTLLDRIIQWIGMLYERFVEALGGVPHAPVIATMTVIIVALLVVARVTYANRLRTTVGGFALPGRSRRSDATDPWREAEELASSGKFTEAAHALYRATLVRLAANGLIRLHESKTNGDYARELRRRGARSYEPFRRFGLRYDRIIYGTGVCDATSYQALLDAARSTMMHPGREQPRDRSSAA